MIRIADTIDRLLGLDELSERLFGEGPEALERRRRWCAWLSLPAAVAAFAALLGGWTFLSILLDHSWTLAFLLMVLPTGVLVTLTGYLALWIAIEASHTGTEVERFVSSIGFLISTIVYFASLFAFLAGIPIAILVGVRLLIAALGNAL